MTLEYGIVREPGMNLLIRSLPDEEYARILPKLQLVSLPLGKVIFESGDKLSYIYFPVSSVVSLLYIMENGGTAEIGIAGKGGLVGMPLFLGGDTTTGRAVVQSAGKSYRMKAADLKAEFALGGEFQSVLLLYTQAMMTQISQTAVCNRLHSIHQQLCRWLLISHDQLVGDKLVMTHDLIANMLGVRREGVTHAAGHLQDEGYIKYSRGTVWILDRKGLENACCECYEVVSEEYGRLLNQHFRRYEQGWTGSNAAN